MVADSSQATGLKWAAAAATNGPAMSVYRTTAQTVTASTWTKVQYTAEEFDTDNCYDNATNYRFTPTKSGYYYVQHCIIGNGTQNYAVIYKNGTRVKGLGQYTSGGTANGSTLIYLNGSTDYIEFWAYLTGGTSITETAEYSYASAVWIRS